MTPRTRDRLLRLGLDQASLQGLLNLRAHIKEGKPLLFDGPLYTKETGTLVG